MATVFWQLWLARTVVADQRLTWERPQPPERLSPGRVRRAFSGLLPTLGTPAQAAQPRGKPPAAVQANVPDPPCALQSLVAPAPRWREVTIRIPISS